MPTAIVTGATGILGREIVNELGKNRQQGSTVHALSRSKKDDDPDNAVHNHIDLQSLPDDMARDLKNVRGEYIFFAAYLQKDTEQETWQHLWPRVTEYFGTTVKPDQFASAYAHGVGASIRGAVVSGTESSESALAPQPPVSLLKERIGLVGTPALEQSKVEQHIDLVKWSQRSDAKQAWAKIAQRDGLDESIFDKATWGFLGFVLGRNSDLVISMSKAGEAGWTGYQDTWGSLKEVFDEMRENGIIPKA